MATTTKFIATLFILSLLSLSPACCNPSPTPSSASTPSPTPSSTSTPSPAPSTTSTPSSTPAGPTPMPASPTPMPATAPSAPTPAIPEKCPLDTLKLGACADVLGLVRAVVDNPPSGPKCCDLIAGLANLKAAACLCTAIKANILGINLKVPLTLSLILSACQKEVPPGFKCQ